MMKKWIEILKKRKTAMTIAVILVVFVTTYTLILPALTIEKDTAAEQAGIVLDQDVANEAAAEAVTVEKEAAEDTSQAESAVKSEAASESKANDQKVSEEKAADQKADVKKAAEEKKASKETSAVDMDKEGTDEIANPAQNFEKELKKEGIKVSVKAEKGALPEGTKMEVEAVNDKDVLEKISAEAEEKAAKDTTIGAIQAVDISFWNDGKEIEPEENVYVTIASDLIKDTDEQMIIHVNDEDSDKVADSKKGKAEVVKAMDAKDLKEKEITPADGEIVFEADQFSVYGIVIIDELPEGELITKTYEDDNWLVTAAYTTSAEIPDESELRVSELTYQNDPDAYEENAQMVFDHDEGSDIYAMLDIGFWVGEAEIEPEDTVYVTIKFKDTEQFKEGDAVTILHREEDQLTCVGYGELDEKMETTYEVDSFSLFIITNEGKIQWVQWTTATSNYDPDWVSRGGTVNNFTKNLPLGTAAITSSMAVKDRSDFTTTDSNVFQINGSYVQCKAKNTTGSSTLYDATFTVTWNNAVTLQDGSLADLVVTGKNLKTRNAAGWQNLFNGTQAAVNYQWGGLSIDLEYSVQRNGEKLEGYSLLFGTNDIDQPDRCRGITYYQVTKATDGGNDLIAYALANTTAVTNGTYIRYSEPLTEQDAQNGKIQLANASKKRLYWTDASESQMTTEKTSWPVYALYKVYRSGLSGQSKQDTLGTGAQTSTAVGSENRSPILNNVYVTREPVEYAETVSISGLKSKMYIPAHNFLHFDVLNGMYRASSIVNDSSAGSNAAGTAATGFFALVDSAGYTIRYTGSQGIGIGLTSSTAYYKIISTTGQGGNITTTDTDIFGNQVTYGPGLLAVPKGKTVPYSMTPETFHHAKTVTIWDGTQAPENRSVIPVGDMLDDEAWIDVDGESFTQKTVTVPYKDESDEYAQNPPGGTESTITYILRKDSSGTITGYRNVETTDAETGDTTNTEEQAFTYSNGTFTDSVRKVSYGITIDANGVLQYTFANVQANHWIDVRWEKDPPQEAVIITKTWDDSGNARQSRPENIIVHLISTNGVRFSNGSLDLVTGTDSNINGNTSWVKDGDNWTYTFGDIPTAAEFAVYEESVSDYSSDHVGADHKKTVTDYTESTDATTGQVTRTYAVKIENKLSPGKLEFTKLGEKKNSAGTEFEPLKDAVFTLFTDFECLYPVKKTETIIGEDGEESEEEIPVTAISGTDGKVEFSNIPCGMYYMKETTVPGDYASNAALYQVQIHEDSSKSTIKVVDRDPDGSGTLEGSAADGYTIKNILAKFDVILLKVSVANNQLRLPSALFVLYGSDYLDENGNVNESAQPLSSPIDASKWYDANVGTSNSTRYGNIADERAGTFYSSRQGNKNTSTSVYGRAPLGALKSGTYYLVELEPPAGYVYPKNPITTITVGQNGVTAMPYGGVSQYTVSYTINNGVYTYTVAVPNSEGVELPMTGGSGTLPYTLGGIALIMASALMYGFRMRRRERRLK